MRAFVIVLALASLCASQQACSSSQNVYITNNTATFGCTSVGYSYFSDYCGRCRRRRRLQPLADYFTGNNARLISFSAGSVDSNYNGLYFSTPFVNYHITESTHSDLQYFIPAGPGSQVVFTSNQYGEPGAWTASVSPSPDFYTLSFGQTTSTERQQSGGFVYFALPNATYGATLTLSVVVNQYQGLQSPAVFLSANTLPTLTYYDYHNNTQGSSGGAQTAEIAVNNPATGWWMAGVFLYGTTADIDVIATWNYNFKLLPNGVATTGTVSTTAVYYQVIVPVNSNKLLIQLSRQTPGGHVSLYLGNSDPLQTTPITVLSTAVNSYQTYTVQNPNPSGNPYPNPGVYVIALTCDTSQCGYIVEATWA